ncbi:drug resistance transporter, EmrB/QacA subfamily [Cryobacterium flavum]|uniref:Drug resistance transporter, EmrB/QacA subfamily n=2 Tax=Cryobacterium flavum TaxID=1424659 RepID=A0A5E9FZY0_9MICO|nr:drug resistance transporter, EmrB/QacA subfamily [Cryobacterium flavum]
MTQTNGVRETTNATPPPTVAGAATSSTSMTGKQRLILVLLLTASFTLAVDFSILNVALPAIGDEIGFGLDTLQWVATSFALCAAGFTLLFGRVGDLVGRRRLFVLGMAVLGVGSLIGGLATSPALLLIARALQGLATAAVVPAALSLLTTTFPEGKLREKALGLNGALMAAGFTTGAILGGVLTDLLSWRWAFFINVPIAFAVVVLAPMVVAESRPANRSKMDLPGAITVTAGLLAIVYGLSSAAQTSWTDPVTVGSLGAGVLLLVLFWAVERKAEHPLVPFAVLRRSTIAWGNIAGMLAFVTETSLVFLLTLYLQKTLGYSPLMAGLSFAVLGIGTVLGGIVGPRIIGRWGTKTSIVWGFVVQAAATGSLLLLSTNGSSIVLLLIATFVGGVANLVVIVGFMVTATSGLPDREQGLATGLATMSQQVGITLGIPIMSAIVAARVNQLGVETSETVLSGVSDAIVVNTALCLVTALAVALFLRLPNRPKG